MVKNSQEQTDTSVPADFLDLFEKKSFATFTTILPNDAMHVTMVWIDYDGSHLFINSAEGRRKVKNARHNPNVGLLVFAPDNPYRYLWVAGRVTEITSEGAESHADELAQRYLGVDEYPYLDQDPTRVLLKISPDICHGYASRVLSDFDEGELPDKR
jgi:PPOX class probable F420-dependent enzyme